MNGGQSWAFETYRKRPNAPRGTMAYLFRTVIDQLQDEGVQAISLCLVPGKGVNNKAMRGDDCRVRWLLGLWYKRLNFLFNTAGQDFFKSRFRPRYEDRFLCVYPGNSWRSILSFFRTTGGLRPNLRNLLAQCFQGSSRSSTPS